MRVRPGALLLAAFLVVPVLELAVAIQVGRWIGVVPTVLLLIVESLLGAWIVRREGAAAWRALEESVQSGLPPSRQLADAALVLIGGTLLLTPGFLTDIVGFVLVIPFTRSPARRLVTAILRRSLARRLATIRIQQDPGYARGGAGGGPGPVIQGTVISSDTAAEPVDDATPSERPPPPG